MKQTKAQHAPVASDESERKSREKNFESNNDELDASWEKQDVEQVTSSETFDIVKVNIGGRTFRLFQEFRKRRVRQSDEADLLFRQRS